MTIVEQALLALGITGLLILWAKLKDAERDRDERSPDLKQFRDRTRSAEYGRQVKGQ